jgi:hypothetical protein
MKSVLKKKLFHNKYYMIFNVVINIVVFIITLKLYKYDFMVHSKVFY